MLLLAAAAFGQTIPATQPTTQPAYPAWAMKAFDNDISRLAAFDHPGEAIKLGLSTLAELEKNKAPALQRANVMCDLSGVYIDRGKFKSAAALLDQAEALLRDQPHNLPGDLARASLLENRAELAKQTEDHDQCSRLLSQALDLHKQHGDDDTYQLRLKICNNDTLDPTGATEPTVEQAQALIDEAKKTYGDGSGPAIDAQFVEAFILLGSADDLDRAAQIAQDTEDLATRTYGPISSTAAAAVVLQAIVHSCQHHDAKAVERFELARTIAAKALGDSDPDLAFICLMQADCCLRQGDTEQAEALYKDAVRISDLNIGENPKGVTDTLDKLAKYYRSGNEDDKAAAAEKRAADIRDKYKLPPAKP